MNMKDKDSRWYQKRKLKWFVLIVVLMAGYVFIQAFQGPFSVLINAPGEDGYFVAKLIVKGPQSFPSGHSLETRRFTLYEQTKVVKANEVFQFEKMSMWTGLLAHESRLYLYQPGYYFRRVPFYTSLFVAGDGENGSVNKVEPMSWSSYIDTRQNKQAGIQISPRDEFWGDMDLTEVHYIPALEAVLSHEETWQEVSRMTEVCRQLYENDKQRLERVCNDGYIKKLLKWDE